MQQDQAIATLEKRLADMRQLQDTSSASSPAFVRWHRDTEIAIERVFGSDSRHLGDFRHVSYHLTAFSRSTPESEFVGAYRRGLQQAEVVLQSMIGEIKDYGFDNDAGAPDALTLVERICLKFHAVARQMRDRYANRETLRIEDEYDVQDLLHALLKVHFEDIRPEEWTPSYAGASSRVDFLLKSEQIVIEVKKTRSSMSVNDLGAQLLVDVARYQRHPDCKLLVCFVYDPEGRVGNPTGLERDLEDTAGAIKVRAIVGPRS